MDKIKYEVRQLVGNIKGKRLEVVYTTEVERVAKMSYKGVVEENPDEYFELIKVEHKEECLEFTPNL